jgi:predicted GNAT superfamily acetyltransferase
MVLRNLKRAGAARLAEVLSLNHAVEDMTSPLDLPGLERLLAQATFAKGIAGPDGPLAAFLIGFGPGAAYASPNYLWFAQHLPRFAYIDRVVVAEAARGQGHARELYAAFAEHARAADLGPLVCEVNLDPPNPGSDAFHAALGFREMGRASPSPGKTVRYLIREG